MTRSRLVRELVLVLLVGVVPMILIGATLFSPSAEEPPPPFPIAGVDPTVRATLMIGTYILFFLAPAIAIGRSGQPLEHFGIVWRPGDFKWGLWSFVINYVLGWGIWLAYKATSFPLGVEAISAFHYVHASSLGEMVSTWPYYILVIIAEEQMARCYLITRFRDLTGSDTFAIIASSLLFASWHTFWGAAGVIHIIKAGLVFGWFFCRRRGVGAAAVGHFVFDALSLLPR